MAESGSNLAEIMPKQVEVGPCFRPTAGQLRPNSNRFGPGAAELRPNFRLPSGVEIGACWSTLGQLRRNLPHIVRLRRLTLAKFGLSLPSEHRPNFDRFRTQFGEVQPALAQICRVQSNFGRKVPIAVPSGENRSILAQLGSTSVQVCPSSAESGHNRPEFGRVRPKFAGRSWAKVGPKSAQ